MKSSVRELVELAIWVFGVGGTIIGALKVWYDSQKIKPLQNRIEQLEKEMKEEKESRVEDVKDLYEIIIRK